MALGRRGVFDGVIEALHQHWKHREVVKVITMQRTYAEVIETANLLEVESSGNLVSVDELKQGHAIIIYRGKNYRRPLKLPTEHLLTKRNALLRSLEMQRFGVSICANFPVWPLLLSFTCSVAGVLLTCLSLIFVPSQSLKFFAHRKQQEISDLKLKLVRILPPR